MHWRYSHSSLKNVWRTLALAFASQKLTIEGSGHLSKRQADSDQSRIARKFRRMTIVHDRIRADFLGPKRSNRTDNSKLVFARVFKGGGISNVSDW
jgi:hypothetical protein